MSIPNDRKYAASHEWIKAEGDVMLVGITGPAQEQLGDLVFVGDVKVGAKLAAGATAGVVESVKAASDIFAPFSGQVATVNTTLETKPGLINTSPYADGWIAKIKIEDSSEKNNLMNAAAYKTFVEGLSA